MFNRSSVILAFLSLMGATGASVASAWEWSRLDMTVISAQQQLRSTVGAVLGPSQSPRAALGARQDLYDEVCMARADGRVSKTECRHILGDAKKILKPEEYAAFEQTLIPLSPEYIKAHQPAKIVPKIVQKVVQKEQEESATVMTIQEVSSEPMIPTSVIRPERIAFRTRVR
jgi:hypothetical protein